VTSPVSRPYATVTVAGGTVPASEGSVVLDSSVVPYGRADVTVALLDTATVEDIDPRDTIRAVVVGGDDVAGTSRTFDLGVRSRTVDHADRTIRLELATDEALLIDYAPLTDVDLWAYRASLRGLVNEVLDTCIPGAVLAASPNPDADVTPRWEQTNLIVNPNGGGGTTGWTAEVSGGVAGSLSTAVPASVGDEGASPATYIRFVASSGGTGTAIARFGTTFAESPRVSPGTMYTFSAWVYQNTGVAKSMRVLLGFRNAAFAVVTSSNQTVSVPSGVWTKLSTTSIAPVNAEVAVVTAGVLDGVAAADLVGVTGVMLAEGARNDRWFDGDRADESMYTYDWTPAANTTPSTRTPVTGEADRDALLWRAGMSAWDFLEPLTASVGLKLFCDESRVWRLVDTAEYFAAGLISISPMNSTEGTDTIDLNNRDLHVTGVAVRYKWVDSAGRARSRTDTAGAPGRVLILEVERPWPGAGVAQTVLNRRTGQGREQETVSLANWEATPTQVVSISLPGTLDQLGQIESINWGLSNGLMATRTRELADVLPGSIDSLTGFIADLPGFIDAL